MALFPSLSQSEVPEWSQACVCIAANHARNFQSAKGFCRAKFWAKFVLWRAAVRGEVLGGGLGRSFWRTFRAWFAGTLRAPNFSKNFSPKFPKNFREEALQADPPPKFQRPTTRSLGSNLRTPDPANSLCLPPFPSKYRKKCKHKEFRGGPKFSMPKFFVCGQRVDNLNDVPSKDTANL